MPPSISINLATHNRAAFLEPCLVSLCEQTLDPSRYEICVVANACTDNTAEIIDKITALYPQHHIFRVDEAELGLSRARNRGLQATTAPLVAHIDDDGTVNPDWLERFLKYFAEAGPELSGVSGEVEPVWGAAKPVWLTQVMQNLLSAGTSFGQEPRFLGPYECACEGNCCYRRSALEAAGNFPVGLGRVGSLLMSGDGIVDMSIQRNGGKIFFDPTILLKHYIHPERLTPEWMRHRFFWQGISSVAICEYELRRGTAPAASVGLTYPLTQKDWDLIDMDTTDGLERNAQDMQGLGFMLALSGIVPISSEDGVSISEFSKNLAATKAKYTPSSRRQHSFWQGVGEYSARDKGKKQGKIMGPEQHQPVPLGHATWTFVNNRNETSSHEQLDGLRAIGYRMAQAGFIPVT